jgi:hypothetical protein
MLTEERESGTRQNKTTPRPFPRGQETVVGRQMVADRRGGAADSGADRGAAGRGPGLGVGAGLHGNLLIEDKRLDLLNLWRRLTNGKWPKGDGAALATPSSRFERLTIQCPAQPDETY